MSQCGFDGNADTYGLGVRLGAYFSWSSIAIASTFFPSARNDLLDALVIFSIAFFAAVILESLDSETYTAELVIMGYIFFGGIVTTSISLGQGITLGTLPGDSDPAYNSAPVQEIPSNGCSLTNHSSPTTNEEGTAANPPTVAGIAIEKHGNPSLWRGTVIVLCVVGMAIHTFWLYWVSNPFRETPCGTWVFPWGRLHNNSLRRGPVLTFAILSFVAFPMCLTALLGMVLFGPDMLAILQAFVLRRHAKTVQERWFPQYSLRVYDVAQSLRGVSRFIKKGWPRNQMLKPLVVVASLFSFVLTVCGIELMVQENAIRGADTVDAPGQLIPLVIGIATLGRLIYIVALRDFDLPPLIWGFSFGIVSLVLPQSGAGQQSSVELLSRVV